MTKVERFLMAAHDAQVEDKMYLAGELVKAHAALDDIAHKRMSLMDCQDAAKSAINER